MVATLKAIVWITLISFLFLNFSVADPKIPEAPSIPPSLAHPPRIKIFRCERFFIYQGKTLDCDSNLRQDGERLRPIIQDVPEAIAELNTYQANRRHLLLAAYPASVGLVLLIGGLTFLNKNNSIWNPFFLSGLALAGGSFLYGMSVLRTNEAHLGSAIDHYNRVHPETPIELQFSTGVSF